MNKEVRTGPYIEDTSLTVGASPLPVLRVDIGFYIEAIPRAPLESS